MIQAKNVNLFKKSLEILSGLIQETNIRIKDDGIYVKAIDKTQIILIDFYMPKACFDNYIVEPNLLGVNITELYNMISRSFDKDKLKIELKDNFLDIYLIGQIQRRFNLPFIDLSESDISTPNIKYDISVKVNAFLLKEILKDASLVGTTIIFKAIDGRFVIEAEGDKGKIETEISKVAMKGKQMISAKYSLSFLKNITKSMDNVDLLLKFSDDSPLYVEYILEDQVKINFYLSSMLI
jgi:DNA polymerase III sliding clamp (beta) subunit (PCNA family)